MPDLPTGTVTFLFTDIEGSTQLWEEHPEGMRTALARHDALLRDTIEANGGAVFKTVGDEFCAAFAIPAEAVAAALRAQQALHGVEAPLVSALTPEGLPRGAPLRVRIALHTGAAEERSGDYFGLPVNRVARLLEVAHGGQVLLSLATQELARDQLPVGAGLRDLGQHRLRDLVRPERIFQLQASGLPAEFPPLKTLDSRPNNLPAQPTLLIGRERELAAAGDLLRRDDVRLLTLTGTAGAGKTRLGMQIAAELLDCFADGVYVVALAPIHDPAMVVSPIAQALEVRENGDRPLLERLKEHLREKQLLLLLDNFEQVLAAAPRVAELLEAAPRLKIMVTSRAALRLRGEYEFLVPPLALPDPRCLPPIATLSQYAAVQLFVQRAVAVSPDFAVTNDNAAAVAAICHCLDGLPLAIELAAARVKLLPPTVLLDRLQSRLKVLIGGARDLPARQQTLRGAIAWSYDLLDDDEKALFRRLAVFVGGCTLEAVEAVCDPERELSIDPLDGIGSLMDKSLLRQEEAALGSRFVMLETIREYARECLEASTEAAVIRRLHAGFFLEWAEHTSEAEAAWLEHLEHERDNLRAALAWCVENRELVDAFRLAKVLYRLWYLRGYWGEGRERLAALLALPGAPTPARALALRQAGQLAWLQTDYAAARSLLEQSIALYRELGDPDDLPAPLNALGEVARTQGDYPAARLLFEESLAIMRRRDDRANTAWALQALGEVAREQGDAAAPTLIEESLTLFREVADLKGISFALCDLGEVARARGELRRARELHQESLAIRREIGHKGGIARSLLHLGAIAAAHGEIKAAQDLCRESLALRRELGDRRSIAACLELQADIAVRSGLSGDGIMGAAGAALRPVLSFERAARLFGAAEALREALGAPLPPSDRAHHEQQLETVRAALGEPAFIAAWKEGRAMSSDRAIGYALEDSPDT